MTTTMMKTVPLEKVTTLISGLRMVYIDYWWPISDDECVYVFGPTDSPQCNASKPVVERIVGDGANYPGFQEIRQLPYVSFRINPRDYV